MVIKQSWCINFVQLSQNGAINVLFLSPTHHGVTPHKRWHFLALDLVKNGHCAAGQHNESMIINKKKDISKRPHLIAPKMGSPAKFVHSVTVITGLTRDQRDVSAPHIRCAR
jgi:hypothetical protein